MDKKDIQRRERKSISVSIRITKRNSKFMKDNNISPNALFDKVIEELMSKDK